MSARIDFLEDKTAIIIKGFEDGADEAMGKCALDCEAQAKLNITDVDAVDTGAARASIHSEFVGHHGYAVAASEAQQAASQPGQHSGKPHSITLFTEEKAEAHQAIVLVGVDYGIHIEIGTAKMAARPFLGPAAEKIANEVDGIVTTIINGKLPD